MEWHKHPKAKHKIDTSLTFVRNKSFMKKESSIGVNEFALPFVRFGFMLVIYQALRLLFFAFNTSFFPHVSCGSFLNLMLGGLRFDLSALIYINLLYVLAHILSFRAKFKVAMRRVLDVMFVLFNSIGILGNCCDFIYYRFTLRRTTFNVIDIFKHDEGIGGLLLRFPFDYWQVTLVFIAFVVFLVWVTRKFKATPSRLKTVPYAITYVAYLAIVIGLSVAGIRGGFRHSTRPIAMSNAAAYTVSPEESAIVLNTPFCFLRTIGKNSYPKVEYFKPDEVASIYTPVHPAPVDSSAMRNPKNVVVFILESFGREFVGTLNKDLDGGTYKGYTPFLDSLAEHSYVFENAFANGRKSIDAMPSVLASIPALIMPYVISEYGNNRVNSLASLLGREGYSSAFFHGAPNGSMGFDGFAKSAGFDKYMGKDEYDNDDDFDGWWGIWDEKFFQFYAKEIGNMKTPFCTALFSLSSHHPFQVPEEYEGVFPKGTIPLHQCIGYSDNALRKFFATAKNEPWFNNTIFVLTADHSVPGDHPEYNNLAMDFAIPIFIYEPGNPKMVGRDTLLAQQADILPTILGLLGYNHPFVSFGNDLFKENGQRFVVNYNNDMYQIFKNDTLAVFDGQKIFCAFDMRKDPKLKQNIASEGNTDKIQRLVEAYIQQFNYRMIGDSLTVKE